MGRSLFRCFPCNKAKKKKKKDYELGGLNAPKLLEKNEKLKKINHDQNQTNEELTSRVAELESLVQQTHHFHAEDLLKLQKEHEKDVNSMRGDIELLSHRIAEQRKQNVEATKSLKNNHEKKIKELTSSHEDHVEDLETQWNEDRQRLEEEFDELKLQVDKRVDEKVQEIIQPYINAYEENKSLQVVIEMKTAEYQKLKAQVTDDNIKQDQILILQEQVARMQQKMEDLTMQVHEKTKENRLLQASSEKYKRLLSEEQQETTRQERKIEELIYRLNTSSPKLPMSPFNPVFTQSPTRVDDS